MNFEGLFSEQKWNILTALAEDKYSPLQLAKMTNTTMANISQQLRLLEVSNIVKKEKVSNRDKGKPRSLFSLSQDHAYLIAAMNGFADKKLMKLDKFHNLLFRIWFFDNKEVRYCTEKFLWEIESSVEDIESFIIKPEGKKVEVLIVSAKNLEKIKTNYEIKSGQISKTYEVKVVSAEEAKKFQKDKKGIFSSPDFKIIFDPKKIFYEEKRGGDASE